MSDANVTVRIIKMPIGTRVRLASGGPLMVVVENLPPDDDGMAIVRCAWENGEHDFPIVCLDVVRHMHPVK